MTRRLSFSLGLLAAGVALVVAAGLVHSAGSAAAAQKGGTLRLSRHTDIDFVDPGLAYYSTSASLMYATCANLFNYPDAPGAAGLRLIPEVVRTYTVSRDGRTYTFDLRRTFRFHSGAQVTARSYVDAFNRVANPKLGSPATPYMREIVGAEAVIAGRAKTISGVRALGPYRLRIRLTQPVGDFTARLTMAFFCPILPNTPVDPKGIDDPAGSGPYYVAERVVNQRVILKRNPYYRGNRPANVGRDEAIDPVAGDVARAQRWLARAARKPAEIVLYAFTDRPGNVAAAQVFASSMKRIGIHVEVKYFEQLTQVRKVGTRGEPFDVAMLAWTTDYADPAGYFEPLLNGANIGPTDNLNAAYFDDPRVNARIAAAGRLRGGARRKAWADLDVDLMRNNPPWAPYFHTTRPNFVSQSYGCFLYHPFYGVDFAAACKK